MTTMIFNSAFCPVQRSQLNWQMVQDKVRTGGAVLGAMVSSGFVLGVLAHAFYAVS